MIHFENTPTSKVTISDTENKDSKSIFLKDPLIIPANTLVTFDTMVGIYATFENDLATIAREKEDDLIILGAARYNNTKSPKNIVLQFFNTSSEDITLPITEEVAFLYLTKIYTDKLDELEMSAPNLYKDTQVCVKALDNKPRNIRIDISETDTKVLSFTL